MSLHNRKSMEPELKDEVKFYPHQVDGIRTLARKNSFLLADDMGLGKSLQALSLFVVDIKMGGSGIGIVVCPVNLKDNWADEIEKFTRIKFLILGIKINPKTGRPRSVMSKYDRSVQILEFAMWAGPKILILNYEQVAPHLLELNALRARVAIFDEAHAMKNPESKRTEAAMELYSERSFVLTGTPLLNNVTELWPLLHRIAPKTFDNSKSFNNRYAVFGGPRGSAVVSTKNVEELNNLLAKVMVRRLKKDVLDLPDVQYIPVSCPLTPLQEKLYEQVHDEFRLEGIDPEKDEETVVENALTQFLRLKQICGTPFSLSYQSGDADAEQYPDESAKLDLIMSRAKEISASGEKIMIFSQFRGVVEALHRRMTEADLVHYQIHGGIPTQNRSEIVKEWGRVNGQSILLMTTVGGVGLNMVQARIGFFADKLFVPGLNQQIVDRLHRIGQSETIPVQIFEFIAKGTIEDRIEQILRGKKFVNQKVIEDVAFKRELLKAIKEAERTGVVKP